MVRWNSIRCVQEVASRVGVELEYRLRGAAYNGRTIVCTDPKSPATVHDIAHFQCAAGWRRGIENFALGPTPFDPTPMPRSHTPSMLLASDGFIEELCAAALTDLYLYAFGMFGVRVMRSEGRIYRIGFQQVPIPSKYDWFRNSDEYLACVEWLKKERIVDSGGNPTFETRKSNDETFHLFGPFVELGMISWMQQ